MVQDNTKKGFSRRHETNDAHETRRANRIARLEGQMEEAKDRVAMSDHRKPSEQLARLNKMFGEDVGAVKERAKLKLRIAAGDKSRIILAEEKAKRDALKDKGKVKKNSGNEEIEVVEMVE